MEVKILKPGLTMEDDFLGWNSPGVQGHVLIRGTDEFNNGITLKLSHREVKELAAYTDECLVEALPAKI